MELEVSKEEKQLLCEVLIDTRREFKENKQRCIKSQADIRDVNFWKKMEQRCQGLLEKLSKIK